MPIDYKDISTFYNAEWIR